MALPKPVLSYDLKSDMNGYILSHNQQVWVLGNTTVGDILPQMWRYDAFSTASPSATVVKPDELLSTDPGRYIFQYEQPAIKKIETFSGTSNASGNYTVTFATAYANVPNIQPQPINPDVRDVCRVAAASTTGFTINIQRRTDLAGLVPTYAAVNGALITVLVTQS